MMRQNEVYRGFVVLDTVPLEECGGQGVWLRHERTGMEVFHIVNDDRENLFAFAFRTPSRDSTGAAHVLEHSVLCGSERFPLKDPFLRLANQSINTYLNAYTAADHTVFPASSIVKADYFNLFSVYADAVFFPLLRPEIFSQECHRLELDEKGRPSMQGVVFNEMKGNYASFETVASDAIERAVLEGTSYCYDSGGDPLVIPSLTVAKLRSFHKRHYCPANCLLFLYGNIPTEEQLDFIDETVLRRIASAGKRCAWPRRTAMPVQAAVHASGPAEEDGKNVVALVWRIGNGFEPRTLSRFVMELLFLDELLCGDDCAPVSKALLDSGLGEDIAPQTGVDLGCLYPNMCFALRGVRRGTEKAVKRVILNSLKDLCDRGIPAADIERACMLFDFNNREIKRPEGNPYSLVLLRRCLRGWLYGERPWDALLYRRYFADMKREIDENPDYLPSLIRKYFLSNTQMSLVTVTPSASWGKKRAAQEEKLVREQYALLGKEGVLSRLRKMRRFQDADESDVAKDLIPHVRVSDLTDDVEKVSLSRTVVDGVPLFVSTEPTNGIVYVDIAFPVDVLAAKDYPYIPFLCGAITQLGWFDKRWDEALSLVQGATGNFTVHAYTSHVPDVLLPQKHEYAGRDWIIFHVEALEEKLSEALDLAGDCIAGTDFSDHQRLRDMIASYSNGLRSSVIPNAHIFAMSRASCEVNRSKAVNELWHGVCALFTAQKIAGMTDASVARRLRSLCADITASGALLHVTATRQGVSLAKKLFSPLISRLRLMAPVPPRSVADADFYALTALPWNSRAKAGSDAIAELFVVPGMIGFASTVIPSAPFHTKEGVADAVFAHLLSTTDLWEKIRMGGGAYGAFLSPNSISNICRFLTYRDPKPFDSLAVLKETLVDCANREFSEEEVEKAITGTYSDEITPFSPASRGSTAFYWMLGGMSNRHQAKKVAWLLRLTPRDIHRAALRFLKCSGQGGKTVIVCGQELLSAKMKENASHCINLPI